MRKSTIPAFALLGALLLTLSGVDTSAQEKGEKAPPAKAPAPDKAAPDFVPPKVSEVKRMIAVLQRPISIDKPVELPLSDLLEMFETQYDLTIVVDPKWNRGGAAIMRAPSDKRDFQVALKLGGDDAKVSLRRLKNVRLETALNLALEQVDAGFLIKADHIRIVSLSRWSAETQQFRAIREVYGNNDAPVTDDQLARTIPVVNANYENAPLSEVLRDLSGRTGTTLSVPSVGVDAASPITLTVVNMPLDYAMNVIARQASNENVGNLRAARSGNAIVVDTADRIAELARENHAKANPEGNRVQELQGAIDGLQGKVGELEKEVAELKKK